MSPTGAADRVTPIWTWEYKDPAEARSGRETGFPGNNMADFETWIMHESRSHRRVMVQVKE